MKLELPVQDKTKSATVPQKATRAKGKDRAAEMTQGRRLGGKEHRLLLQRTQLCFPDPNSGASHLPVTPAAGV